jgi:hypothetical protein
MDGYESGRAWPVAWSAVWVGALAALAVLVIIGLLGFAIGAHEVSRAASWRNVRLVTIIFNVAGAFFSFVIGGWIAARIAGIVRADTAILHGGVVWLLTVPMVLLLTSAHASWQFGGWYGGLTAPLAGATAQELAQSVRNGAIAAAVAMLLGLVGAVIGGWMASGEPMTLAVRRMSAEVGRPRRAA